MIRTCQLLGAFVGRTGTSRVTSDGEGRYPPPLSSLSLCMTAPRPLPNDPPPPRAAMYHHRAQQLLCIESET